MTINLRHYSQPYNLLFHSLDWRLCWELIQDDKKESNSILKNIVNKHHVAHKHTHTLIWRLGTHYIGIDIKLTTGYSKSFQGKEPRSVFWVSFLWTFGKDIILVTKPPLCVLINVVNKKSVMNSRPTGLGPSWDQTRPLIYGRQWWSLDYLRESWH